MTCNKTNSMAVTDMITRYGVASNWPLRPTNGEITPPKIN